MKKTLPLLLFFILFKLNTVCAQNKSPVIWKTSVKKISSQEFQLNIQAKIEAGWHLYSQNVPDGGPVATSFTFSSKNRSFSLEGKTVENDGITVIDPVFNMMITYFEKEAKFYQNIKLNKRKLKDKITAVVEFMVCDNDQCLAPVKKKLMFDFDK